MLIHQAALGDFVLTWPILRGWAGTPTLVVSSWSKARLAARVMPHVIAHDIEGASWSRLFVAGVDVACPSGIVERPENIVTFVSDHGDAFTQHLRTLWPEAQIACVPGRPPLDWPERVHEWYVHEARRQGVMVVPGGGTRRENPNGPIVIHPGAGGVEKRWPMERFAHLAATLSARGRAVKCVIGEVELEKFSKAELAMLPADVAVCRDLDSLVDVLLTSRLFIGNDSGPSHLAAALGMLTVVLYGPTSPNLWCPRGPVRVVAPDRPCAMEWLSAEAGVQITEESLYVSRP